MADVRCGVERRRLGRTEHESSVAILGGAAFWATDLARGGPTVLRARPRRRREPPRHRAAVRQRRARRRPAGPRRARPALRGRQDAALEPRRGGGAVRRHPPAARLRGPRPLPGPRRDRPRGARRPRRGHRPDRRAARPRRHAVRRHHRPRPHRAGHVQRGAAPLGPRHRDVPRVPAPVGRPGLPSRRRGAARHLHGARRRRDGHQGRRPAAVGRRPVAGRVARRRPGHRRALGGLLVRAGRAATPSRGACRSRSSTPGVHAFCTPGDTGLAPRGARGRRRAYRAPSADERDAAVAEMADEPVIFPIPR